MSVEARGRAVEAAYEAITQAVYAYVPDDVEASDEIEDIIIAVCDALDSATLAVEDLSA